MDLNSMSRKELMDLRAQVDKAIKSAGERERKAAIEAAEKAALEHGFSLSELAGQKKAKAKAEPKYRNPENPEQTWSGLGRKPQWLKSAEAEGKTAEDFAI